MNSSAKAKPRAEDPGHSNFDHRGRLRFAQHIPPAASAEDWVLGTALNSAPEDDICGVSSVSALALHAVAFGDYPDARPAGGERDRRDDP